MPTPSEIQTCIDNLTSSSAASDFLLIAAETGNANAGISFSVATENDLPEIPTSGIGPGQVFYVESLGVPVVSTLDGWAGLDGRILFGSTTSKSLYMWGLNICGTLGINIGGGFLSYTPMREVSFSNNWSKINTGCASTTAIKEDGTLWAWGCGQTLPIGTPCPVCSPVQEVCSATNWTQVNQRWCTGIAIKSDGSLWGWGSGFCGALGDGTGSSKCSPVREICSATDWCYLATGTSFPVAAAIKTDGTLWGWGSYQCGLTGVGNFYGAVCSPVREFCSATDWCQVSIGTNHANGLKTSGQLWSWGYNDCGSLACGSVGGASCSPIREFCSATNWCQAIAGFRNSFAIKTDGTLWGWGRNNMGQIGDGTCNTNRCSPVQEFCSATNWCQVAAGYTSIPALKTDGTLWGWGCVSYLPLNANNRYCSPVQESQNYTDWCVIDQGVANGTGGGIRSII